MPKSYEINFDGLVGLTHNTSGLSYGNTASMTHAQMVSNPRAAALQGLEKMMLLLKLGLKQGILPPHERPMLPFLYHLGYRGNEQEILHTVWKENPQLLMAASSASSMWAANAATICPSADAKDCHVHFTPANLTYQLHRSFEHVTTGLILTKIFANPRFFTHHLSLPSHLSYSDEGAANHSRLCQSYGEAGIQLFVYGRSGVDSGKIPAKFPARQTLEASQAIVRLHQIPAERVVYAQQNPEAIDAGVFHNDVISVANERVFFYHEEAFVNTEEVVKALQEKMEKQCQTSLIAIKVSSKQVSLKEAVESYLFNSQLVTVEDGSMVLIAPTECQENENVHRTLNELLQDGSHPIKKIIYQNVRESMRNGGGPACLRLRVALTEEQLGAILPSILLTEPLYHRLVEWVKKHYRDKLVPADLADPHLLKESWAALDELSFILQLGRIYPFQR